LKFLRRLMAEMRTFAKANRNRTDLTRFIIRRPAIAAAIAGYETAILVSNRMDVRAKHLATTLASSLIGCPF
jgi:hypothetical protein